jgi:hypothetical protein
MRIPAHIDGNGTLVKGFKDATRRLALLNRQSCSNQDFLCKASLYLMGLKEMESQGFDWAFGRAILEAEKCERLFKSLDTACLIDVLSPALDRATTKERRRTAPDRAKASAFPGAVP